MSRRRQKHFNGCRGKARYGSYDEAKSEQPAQAAYLCPGCACWHLTSAKVSTL